MPPTHADDVAGRCREGAPRGERRDLRAPPRGGSSKYPAPWQTVRMRTGPRRAARIALGIVGGVVVVLGLAQLLLPRLAAQRVRSQIARYGVVRSASVSAFPAIELLWGEAQSATVNAAHLDITETAANELLWESRGVERIDMHAESMHVGSLTLRDVSWRKRGDRLEISGRLTEADLRASLPGATSFALLSSNSEGVSMRVSGYLFGLEGSVAVTLSAVDGKLVAEPQGIPFAGLVKVTLFSASHAYVQSFGLTEVTPAGADPAYHVRIAARLR